MSMRRTAAAALVAVAASTPATSQEPATAGSGVEVVQVPVSVRDGARAVSGLLSTDFVLTDNGVRQDVEALSVESIPADVTLIMDAAGSTTGIADRLARDIQQIARLLRPADALRLLRIDTFVEEFRPATPGTFRAPSVPASSVHDALIVGLMRPVGADRRHLVVAITDALDTMSATTADRVREVASRSESVLQIVIVRPPEVFRPATSFMRPRFSDQNLLILTEAAERTGGELRGRGFFGDADPVSAFKKVFDDFRQSYLLRYSPREVETAGWHELTVTVPQAPALTIRARTGYSSDRPF